MKVRTLIELLETHDPEMEVYIQDPDNAEFLKLKSPVIDTAYYNDDVNDMSIPHSILVLTLDESTPALDDYQAYDTPEEKAAAEEPDEGIAELDRLLAGARLGQSIG